MQYGSKIKKPQIGAMKMKIYITKMQFYSGQMYFYIESQLVKVVYFKTSKTFFQFFQPIAKKF